MTTSDPNVGNGKVNVTVDGVAPEMTPLGSDKGVALLIGLAGLITLFQGMSVMDASQKINRSRLPGEPDFASLGAVLFVVSIPMLFAAWGVMKSRKWGHWIALIASGIMTISVTTQGDAGIAILFAPFAIYSLLRLIGTIETDEYKRAKLAASLQSIGMGSNALSGSDHLEKLDRLGSLRERSILTESEFQQEKAKILATTPSATRAGLDQGTIVETEAQRAKRLASKVSYAMDVGRVIELLGMPETDRVLADRTRTITYCSGHLELRFINGCLASKGLA